MPIQLNNSLTKKKEEFIPLKDKSVNIYTCGVTVYDKCHLGHARSLYIFDVIRRYLAFRGYKVRFVRNITDIDEKIIDRANELKKTSEQVAKENIELYYRDLENFRIQKADLEPRATENIPDMVQYITELIKKDYAYAIAGDVYFSVRKFPEYGKLSGQSIDQMQEAVRIEKDSKKKDPLDFALWKKSKENEPAWDSPWGKGRPGWHIECSVMSLKHLKCETLDIHAGGRDLIFPHHENEIAQAESLTKKPLAKYWIHHGLLTINGQKMAKSLGNFITLEDALKKYNVDDLKMFFLFSHYASPVDFSDEKIREAHKVLDRFDILFWKAAEIIKDKKIFRSMEPEFLKERKEEFLKAMDDDFNTPKALATLFDLLSDTNKFIEQEKNDPNYVDIIHNCTDTIEKYAREIFGLFLAEKNKDLDEEDQKLLDDRAKARSSKDFKKSDELRDVLKKHGIVVEDTKEGQSWRWL